MNLEIPDNLEDQIADLYRRMADTERRLQNKKRTGKIIAVNATTGLARVELEKDPVTGEPLKTHWLPWKEIAAGKIKTHIPPSVGEMVDVVSESGDLSDAMIDTSIPSTANPRPHDKEEEAAITVGNVRILIKDGEVSIQVGETLLAITTDGILLKSRGIRGEAPSIYWKGDVGHKGGYVQDGVHVDRNGPHTA